jgi:serine/threonine-protein kinase
MLITAAWQRIEELFHGAVELPVAERVAFLARSCGEDRELRAQVERLLAAGDAVGDRFEQLVQRAAATYAPEEDSEPGLPMEIGRFRATALVGRGGMGEVYLGHRADGEFRQTVAIKLVRRGLQDEEARQRFRQERQVLADLQHPDIARLLDGGTTPEGEPYLVMEYVEGEPIDLYCDRRGLGIGERLRLVQRVSAAVDFAHRHAVVHRDLKPSNILVTRDGEPKLLDFGIAKVLDGELNDPAFTRFGRRALTPESASPEQVWGGRITAATDVYALGLLLYRLLTGRAAQDLSDADDLAQAICELEPPLPSRVVPGLPKALDPIVMKALRKKPEERYASAAELAVALERFVAGRPVKSRVGRRRAGLAVAAAVAIGALAVALWVDRRSSTGERASLSERLAAEARLYAANQEWGRAIETYRTRWMLQPADPEAALDLAAAQVAGGRAREALATLAELPPSTRGKQRDPRIDLTEAEAAGALSDFPRQRDAARRAAARGREIGASQLVARALLAEWWALRNLGDLGAAEAAAAEAGRLFAAAGDRGGEARALNAMATLLADRGHTREAIGKDLEALEIFRQLGDRRRVSWSLNNLARALRSQGDLPGARRMVEESLDICRVIGDRSGIARAEANLGRLLMESGELARARRLHEDSLAIRRAIGEERGIAGALVDLGVVLQAQGRLAEAEKLLRDAGQRFLHLGDRQSAARTLDFVGEVLLARGETTGAREVHGRALALWIELGSSAAAESRLGLARVDLAEGRAADAARRLSSLLAPNPRHALGSRSTLAQALLATARLELGDSAAARFAVSAALAPSNRLNSLADRLAVDVLTARVEGLLGQPPTRALDATIEAARAAGLAGCELEARLAATELNLHRDPRRARRTLESLAQEAQAAGFGSIANRARRLLAAAPQEGSAATWSGGGGSHMLIDGSVRPPAPRMVS